MKHDIGSIRPSSRLLTTLGSDIIKDPFAAIVELVKNAYDADSPSISIKFSSFYRLNNPNPYIRIDIIDYGHGMSLNTVKNKWLVPSTDDKLARKFSPKGRRMQGSKGIGRYAVSILGNELTLITIDTKKQYTKLFINWDELLKTPFLSDITLDIEYDTSDSPSGTTLSIVGDTPYLEMWPDETIETLIKELRKLIPPTNFLKDESSFDIELEFDNFPSKEYNKKNIHISPYPVLELYDYRISGHIMPDGELTYCLENSYDNSCLTDSNPLYINRELKALSKNTLTYNCGYVEFDFRVFDREPEAITKLNNKLSQLSNADSTPLKKNEVRQLLNDICGVKIYRNNFRIRPYGDFKNDWLDLNYRRVQTTFRISTNQIHGTISIAPEEDSNLIEQSSREGLKENINFLCLRHAMLSILSLLETKRYNYRRIQKQNSRSISISQQLDKLFDFDILSTNIDKIMSKYNIDAPGMEEVQNLISITVQEKNKQFDEIKQIIALYEGQATLGKITRILLHEGRRPISWLKDFPDVLEFRQKKVLSLNDDDSHQKLKQLLLTLIENINTLSSLFNKIEPLSSSKRSSKKNFKLLDSIKSANAIFENQLKEKNIILKIDCPEDLSINGYYEDFLLIFTNLIENSIFWLDYHPISNKKILISASNDSRITSIDFIDNGPGILEEYIESNAIFEPEFTTKPNGTSGLGLAIAGEAASRNNAILKAIHNSNGAYFNLELTTTD